MSINGFKYPSISICSAILRNLHENLLPGEVGTVLVAFKLLIGKSCHLVAHSGRIDTEEGRVTDLVEYSRTRFWVGLGSMIALSNRSCLSKVGRI